jgi:hypothetical protein
MPTWWLVRQTRDSNPAVVGPVLRELLLRFESGQLSDRDVHALASQGLQYRDSGAPCGMWNCEYGSLLDIAWARSLLTQAERDSYADNSVGLWWSGPSMRTYEGAPDNPILSVIPLAFVGNPWRSTAAGPPIDFEIDSMTASLDGASLPVDIRLTREPEGLGRKWTAFGSAIVEMPKDWQGRVLQLQWQVRIVDFKSRVTLGAPWSDTRVIKLDWPIRGGARRQDDKVPPQISRM